MHTLDVLAIIHEQEKWTVTTTSLEPTMTAGNRMITDTDRLSFVYLIETGDHYTYLHFDHKDWEALRSIAKQPAPVFLSDGTHTIELLQFTDELIMLLHNIQGNDNYGHQFVASVEASFDSFFDMTE